MTRSRMLLLLPVFSLPAIWASQAVGQLTGVALQTPPLWAEHFVCTVVNSSTSNRLVTAKILDKNGVEITTNPIAGGCTTATLQPGQACGVIAPGNGVRLAYCRILVPLAVKQDVRGSLYGSNQNGASAVVVQAE
jgi:hypothetical protein